MTPLESWFLIKTAKKIVGKPEPLIKPLALKPESKYDDSSGDYYFAAYLMLLVCIFSVIILVFARG